MKSAGLGMALALILLAIPQVAKADGTRSFAMAGRQALLIERMTNSALLAALDVAASPSIGSVHWSQDRFRRTHTELLRGDDSGANRPEIAAALGRVDAQWRQYETIFAEIAGAGDISNAQIRALTASHAGTTAALGEMVDAYGHFVHGGSSHSILSSTILQTGALRAQTQMVLRSLLMVAYGDQPQADRERLSRSTEAFTLILAGLIGGDGELRLLPAPTPEIESELVKVDGMWRDALPILEAAADGERVTGAEIAAMAQHANDMAVPLTMALLMYLAL